MFFGDLSGLVLSDTKYLSFSFLFFLKEVGQAPGYFVLMFIFSGSMVSIMN